jgi:hypothetical protein
MCSTTNLNSVMFPAKVSSTLQCADCLYTVLTSRAKTALRLVKGARRMEEMAEFGGERERERSRKRQIWRLLSKLKCLPEQEVVQWWSIHRNVSCPLCGFVFARYSVTGGGGGELTEQDKKWKYRDWACYYIYSDVPVLQYSYCMQFQSSHQTQHFK